MLKRIAFVIIILLISSSSFARDVHVKEYFRKNGTYVQPHYRSAPDGNPYNNFSTRGNVNPYTGKIGTVDPDNDRYNHKKSNGSYGYQSDDDISSDTFDNFNHNNDNPILEEEPNEEDNN